MDPITTPVPRRRRSFVALTGALSIGVTAALVAPSAALAAAGDNEIVIGVIEQNTPAIVTIQTIRGEGAEAGPEFRVPDDLELPEDFELPEDLEDLGDIEELLPEGFELPEGFDLEDFRVPFGGSLPIPSGTGSGVVVDPDGLIITNGHVVGDAERVRVIMDDGSVYEGEVTGVDTLTDFAFVDVEADDLPAVTLGDSSEIKVGQLAIAIGNPLGRFPSSASVGIISGLDRDLDVFGNGGGRLSHLIQTDAAVNPGNSGGAVFNGDGELIGITTAEAGMSDGIGFALPIDLAKPIIDQAMAGEDITRPFIGVIFRELNAQVAADEGLPVSSGAWIFADERSGDAVVADGPAAAAGIQAGDIITAVEGRAIDGDNPLDLQVLRFAPGDEITFSVLRDGETIDLLTTLGTRPTDLNG